LKIKFLCIFILVIFTAPCVFAAPLENLVSSNHAAQMRSGGSLIIESQLRNSAPLLMPQDGNLQILISGIRNDINPNVIVEALYLYRKPAAHHTSAENWDNAQKTGVFNQIVALSTLTGIQYFSASRNSMRTFYEHSSIIDGPQTKNPRSDPVYSQPPQSLTLYARQKDLTFGDNIYQYNYVNTANAAFFVQENVTSLNYGIIPAIGRGNLKSIIAIFDCGDSILIYIASMAKAFSLLGMGDRISNSFSNRAEAILSWLTGRLDREIFSQ